MKTKTPTAQALRLAASSVRGARSMGIDTAASAAAPNALKAAEAALVRMRKPANKGDAVAQDAEYEAGRRAYAQLAAYESAVEELRAALAGE